MKYMKMSGKQWIYAVNKTAQLKYSQMIFEISNNFGWWWWLWFLESLAMCKYFNVCNMFCSIKYPLGPNQNICNTKIYELPYQDGHIDKFR